MWFVNLRCCCEHGFIRGPQDMMWMIGLPSYRPLLDSTRLPAWILEPGPPVWLIESMAWQLEVLYIMPDSQFPTCPLHHGPKDFTSPQ